MKLCLTPLWFAGTVVLASVATQTPLSNTNDPYSSMSEYYEFKHPIQRVAIIGAGVGCVACFFPIMSLTLIVSQWSYSVPRADRSRVRTHIFERDSVPGGNWHYTAEAPLDAPVPNRPIATGDFVPSLPPDGARLPYEEVYTGDENNIQIKREHRGPKPVWESLMPNAPAVCLR